MHKLFPTQGKLAPRFAIVLVFVTSLSGLSGCSGLKSFFARPTEILVPISLEPVVDATQSQLVSEVNRLAEMRSIKARIDIQFQETSTANEGTAELYRTTDGTVYLNRPGKIYLLISAPFIGTKIAEMTSDGEHFRIAVLQGDEKYRRFVKGTNNAVYPKLVADDSQKDTKGNKKLTKDERTVSAVSNLRPQHLTETLLLTPIAPKAENRFIYSQSEFFQEEADRRPRAKKDGRVIRAYYLLDELSLNADGEVRPLRRMWFDRINGIRLARVQLYDDKGALMSDVSYGQQVKLGVDGNLQFPSTIEVTRPKDHYKLKLTFQSPAEVVVNQEYQKEIFVLENKWQLQEVDLDHREAQRIKNEK